MHELAVAASLYEWALEQSRARAPKRLLAIELEQDSLSCLNPDALAFSFHALSANTELERVRLDFLEVEPTYCCGACGETTRSQRPPAICPGCGGAAPRIPNQDDSLRVRSIEVE